MGKKVVDELENTRKGVGKNEEVLPRHKKTVSGQFDSTQTKINLNRDEGTPEKDKYASKIEQPSD